MYARKTQKHCISVLRCMLVSVCVGVWWNMAKKETIRRIYMRAKKRAGRGRIPVMGLMTVGTLAGKLMTESYGYPKSAVAYLKGGDWHSAVNVMGRGLQKGETYTALIVPLVVWGAGRMFLGKVPLTRKVSLF